MTYREALNVGSWIVAPPVLILAFFYPPSRPFMRYALFIGVALWYCVDDKDRCD